MPKGIGNSRIEVYERVGISIISSLKRRALWRGTIFQRRVYETVNFRLQALRGLYNFVRGFRRAYKQGAYYLLTILICIACRDQSPLWGKNRKNRSENRRVLSFRVDPQHLLWTNVICSSPSLRNCLKSA